MGWLLILGGVAWYFIWGVGVAGALYMRKGGQGPPQPGTGDVPAWVSRVALIGAVALVIVGIIQLFL